MSKKGKKKWWEVMDWKDEDELDTPSAWDDEDRNKTYLSKYNFKDTYSSREKSWKRDFTSSNWKGYDYYKKSSVDYRYIEQVANALSLKHGVKVQTGGSWFVDVKNKVLTYDPISLMTSTKGRILTLLLHEIGHIRHTAVDVFSQENACVKLNRPVNNYLLYQVHLIENLFEDFRIDEIMSKSYGSSEEIFSESREICKENIDLLKKISNDNGGVLNKTKLIQYMTLVSSKSYGAECDDIPFDKEVWDAYEATKESIEKTKKASSTQEVYDELDANVFPKIRQFFEKKDPDKNPVDGGQSKAEQEKNQERQLVRKLLEFMYGTDRQPAVGTRKMRAVAGKNGGRSEYPREWIDGDYDKLKESVDSNIQELYNKLKFIKCEDLTMRFQQNLKKGKLDVKNLYKFKSDRYNFFKKKHEVIDRIDEFCFSIHIDTSSSMASGVRYRERIIESLRGVIMLSEVFEKMEIPFEINQFDSYASRIKSFEQKLNSVKPRIGGLVKPTGGTDLSASLDISQIENHGNKNKMIIVISDGETGNWDVCEKRIKRYLSQGIRIAGFDIGGGGDYSALHQYMPEENVKIIDDVAKLPTEFTELVKSMIPKKKGLG